MFLAAGTSPCAQTALDFINMVFQKEQDLFTGGSGRAGQGIVLWRSPEAGCRALESSRTVEANSGTLPHLFDAWIEMEKQPVRSLHLWKGNGAWDKQHGASGKSADGLGASVGNAARPSEKRKRQRWRRSRWKGTITENGCSAWGSSGVSGRGDPGAAPSSVPRCIQPPRSGTANQKQKQHF